MASPIVRPVFIVGPPRSGTNLLFDLLSNATAFSPVRDAGGAIAAAASLDASGRGWDSHRLTAADASAEAKEAIDAAYYQRLHHGSQRLLEKSEHNALRVAFLAALYPDAQFVLLHRQARFAITAMLQAWRAGQEVTEPELPGWSGPAWSMALVPGWRELDGRPLAELAAAQWTACATALAGDFESLDRGRWCDVVLDDLFRDPNGELARVAAFLKSEVPQLANFHGEELRQPAEELAPYLERTAAAEAGLTQLREDRRTPATAPDAQAPADPAEAFHSVSTPNFPQLLHDLGISLVVTTYQSGRVILVRAPDRGTLNTHLLRFPSPMGAAVGETLAIGTRQEIIEFRNQREIALRVQPPALNDAVWVPAHIHVTGAMAVHELAWAGDELWGVNTLFSALCTFDHRHSFVPRWRPPFVTHLAPEDRCHLNGLAVEGNRVRYVTAFAETNEPGGWRAHKATGGVLIDVESGAVVARGLSMPHSPRLHDGRLWVLESGKGTLATVDPAAGEVRTEAEMPGFTRGLAFAGPFAFVGLSQVRESNVFGGIPLVERVKDRQCGVWIVDLRSGTIAAFLRFEGVVQEIFDVQVMQGIRYPDLLELHDERVGVSFVIPPESMTDVPQA